MLATQNGRSKPVRISCNRSEKLKVSPELFNRIVWREPSLRQVQGRLCPRSLHVYMRRCLHVRKTKAPLNVVSRKPGNSNHLSATHLSGGNSNGSSRHLQKCGEKFYASSIRFAVTWRSREGNF